MSLYRHGDVLILVVDSIPETAKKRLGLILLEGEATGHAHRVVTDGLAELYGSEAGGREAEGLYLRVAVAPAKVVHEEHAVIELPEGLYKVWRQREYDPRDDRDSEDWRYVDD